MPRTDGASNPTRLNPAVLTGCFETLRVYGGRPFLLDEHLVRLGRSLRALGLSGDVSLAGIRDEVSGVLAQAGAKDAGLRITVAAGSTGPAVTVALFDLPYPADPRPASLAWARDRRSSRGRLVRIKSTSAAAENLAAREAARTAGAVDAVFLNERGEVAECASSNIFVVADDAVLTPPIRAGALPGVARATVLALARQLGIPSERRTLRPEDLREADEVFITSSLKEVWAVGMIDGETVGRGRAGPITARIAQAYRAWALTLPRRPAPPAGSR